MDGPHVGGDVGPAHFWVHRRRRPVGFSDIGIGPLHERIWTSENLPSICHQNWAIWNEIFSIFPSAEKL